jgi:NADH:ubiquinone oxidoreductase subunit F (NADH-binding)
MRHVSARREAPSGVRRLLDGSDIAELVFLRGHRTIFAPPAPPRRPRSDIVALVQRAGLRGRGGAGFPTATKLRSVAEQRGRPVVVVNGTEGEPASRKDAMLLQIRPHLVLDGAAQAAAAVASSEIFVCIDRENAVGLASMGRAIEERRVAEPGGAPITLLATPPRYVAGEETALVHWINGGDAKPTNTPPRPFERGVGGRPTLVNNAETFAHLAQIVEFGPEWFRSIGTEAEPGTALATVGGAVERPSVYEMPMGLPLAELMQAAGATERVSGVLVGGYFGSWLSPESAARVHLCNEALRPLGSGFGCGVVNVLGADGCGVVESARVLKWMALETAGQCGPCVNGLHAIATTFGELARGSRSANDRPPNDGSPKDVAQLRRWATQIEGRGACQFPDGAIRFLRSALELFGEDLAAHAGGHPCAGARRSPTLPIPRSIGGWR